MHRRRTRRLGIWPLAGSLQHNMWHPLSICCVKISALAFQTLQLDFILRPFILLNSSFNFADVSRPDLENVGTSRGRIRQASDIQYGLFQSTAH